ncbi:ISAs1 family transposase [Nonomuraea sp. NPDC050783]|uniref:ISAs1 family transposase n=1 Tax=Nonomuraea sp. NPDC050783 TaxID=3154634 RepID=UPI0034651DCA
MAILTTDTPPTSSPPPSRAPLTGLAVDGKTLRGSRTADGTTVHLLAATRHDTQTVVAQRQIDAKSNEIPAFTPLLSGLGMTGVVITADALHTQHEHARHINAAGGHYLFIVKGNQPMAEGWHADDAVLMVEITPQAVVRKISRYIADHGYTLEEIANAYEGAIGDTAHEMGLPWDDSWLQVPFLPEPKGTDPLTGIPVCEHNVQARTCFVQVIRPGQPLPEDAEIGTVGQGKPATLLAVKTRAAAIEGRADQYQIGYLHKDQCRTADDPDSVSMR